MELKKEKCLPCEVGGVPLGEKEVLEMSKMINPEWGIEDSKIVKRTFKFKNFKKALEFVNRVGAIAESEGHHPDIELSWGKVTVRFTTHKIGGLSTNDFIMAAKIDEVEI
ncbi:4a-hydroxytetrahydrobiopterin dehydratase [uncultured Ilyobacter sp.]|uniref:4a-hydroxytetrahydrobiopterin dehydratase n=1 Tax=uncultured Ilyobacter sp. TaxID=544433 RepID=UPI0029C047C1|nr:4a-hydroxytetrahydrobiopterin dehydratase [uncultured Ilyobacter sp.]